MKLGHTGQGVVETQRGQGSQGHAAGGLENLLSLTRGNCVLTEGNGVGKSTVGRGEGITASTCRKSPLQRC